MRWIRAGLAALCLALPAQAQTTAVPGETVQAIRLPGFTRPVPGRWLGPKDNRSGVPLGGLGTGFLELRPDGRIYDAVLQNNWLAPRPPAACALTAQIGHHTVTLLSSASASATEPPPSPRRYCGHFPMADLDYGTLPGGAVDLSTRAWSPFVPGNADRSNTPAALFTVRARNTGRRAETVRLRFRWGNDIGAASRASGNVDGFWGWKRPLLMPGRPWSLTLAHVFGNSDAEIARAAAEARREADLPDLAALERDCTEAGVLLRSESVEITLDAWGGFNWEFFEEETGRFGGVATLGQILYALRWNGQSAALDFAPGAPTTPVRLVPVQPLRHDKSHRFAYGSVETDDHALRLTLCCRLTGRVLTRWFLLQNLTQQPLRDAGFACYLNPDIGGPGAEADDMAEWKKLPDGTPAMRFYDAAHPARLALVSPGAPPTHGAVGHWPDTLAAMNSGDWTPVSAMASPAGMHTGWTAGDIRGVLLRAEGRSGSYALGARGDGWQVTATPRMESSDGLPCAQVEARAVLPPGEERAVTFALAWHFPAWRSSDNRAALNRYATRFADAGEVARAVLADAPALEQAVIAWQEQLYARPLPGWLKDGLVNSLYSLARNTWWLDDGRFIHSESFTGCPITETLVCRYNGSFPLLMLFPEQEKQTMRAFARLQAESGQIAFGFGSPAGLETPMFDLQKPIVSSEFVLMCRRDTLWTNDRAFLKEIYPHAKRAMQYAMTLDTDANGLINDAPGSAGGFPANQYYDTWPWYGHSAYTAGIGLAALRAAEEMATLCGDAEFAGWCREKFMRGQQAYEEDLWNGLHYRLYSDPEQFRQSDTSLTNQLCGQWYAWLCDLGDLHPPAHIAAALRAVGNRNMQATAWGAVSGVMPDGRPDESGDAQSREVVVGEVWNYATTALMAGKRLDDEGLRQLGLQAAERAYRAVLRSGTLWNQHFSYRAKDAAPVWGSHYYSNMCLWALPFGYEGRAMRPAD